MPPDEQKNAQSPQQGDAGGQDDASSRDRAAEAGNDATPSDRREDRRGNGHADRRQHAAPQTRKMPTVLKAAALVVVAAGGFYLLSEGLREPPMLERRLIGGLDGYRLETGRPTPPAAATLSDSFVPVEGVEREQVLQRLAEFRATWKVADPRIALMSADASGDANAFAEQLEAWLEQNDLLSSSAVKDAPAMAGIPGATLPAPPLAGLLIRCRERDGAIARDLALALAPVVGGEVNIVFDERVSASRVQVAIVGAPRFGENGVAYFRAG